MKIEGSISESGSISQRHGSADPDPHQNVMSATLVCRLADLLVMPFEKRPSRLPSWELLCPVYEKPFSQKKFFLSTFCCVPYRTVPAILLWLSILYHKIYTKVPKDLSWVLFLEVSFILKYQIPFFFHKIYHGFSSLKFLSFLNNRFSFHRNF